MVALVELAGKFGRGLEAYSPAGGKYRLSANTPKPALKIAVSNPSA